MDSYLPFSNVDHLPIIDSDYGPILIDSKNSSFHKDRNFRFEGKWLLEDKFLDPVKSVWSTFLKVHLCFNLLG